MIVGIVIILLILVAIYLYLGSKTRYNMRKDWASGLSQNSTNYKDLLSNSIKPGSRLHKHLVEDDYGKL